MPVCERGRVRRDGHVDHECEPAHREIQGAPTHAPRAHGRGERRRRAQVNPDVGHRAEWYRDEARDIVHEELHPDELEEQRLLPDTLPTLDDSTFERFVMSNDLVLVAFGAPWCPWSQRLEPVWRKTWDSLKTKPYAQWVRMGKVDCTAATSHSTCQRHHIHAFPTIRIYRHRQLHSHENYLGDRDSSSFQARSTPRTLPSAVSSALALARRTPLSSLVLHLLSASASRRSSRRRCRATCRGRWATRRRCPRPTPT